MARQQPAHRTPLQPYVHVASHCSGSRGLCSGSLALSALSSQVACIWCTVRARSPSRQCMRGRSAAAPRRPSTLSTTRRPPASASACLGVRRRPPRHAARHADSQTHRSLRRLLLLAARTSARTAAVSAVLAVSAVSAVLVGVVGGWCVIVGDSGDAGVSLWAVVVVVVVVVVAAVASAQCSALTCLSPSWPWPWAWAWRRPRPRASPREQQAHRRRSLAASRGPPARRWSRQRRGRVQR